jgi:uracil-DNA glycosylase
MTDASRLAQEILTYLRFYRDIGIDWVRPAASPVTSRPGASPRVEPRVPSSSPPDPVKSSSRVFSQTRSMFETVAMPVESLKAIRDDLGECQRCKLAPTRTHIVFGSGNPHADLMFVGEAPGADEDEQGLPFVGRAGQLLTKIIEAIDLKRDEVYICNILKCRPPGNRNPEADEVASCEPFLLRQVASVKPKVICALGTFGAQTLLRTKEPISKLRGQFFDFRGAKFIATFHPAYLLRNPYEKRRVWEDFQKIRDYLKSLASGK